MSRIATLSTVLAIAVAPAAIGRPADHRSADPHTADRIAMAKYYSHQKPRRLLLKQKDSGRTVGLVPGQELRIRLKVCPSCGYSWATQLAPDKAVLRRLKQRQWSSGDCQPPCVGGPAATIFRYRARADGTTKLRLGYIPPGQQPADKVFTLRVIVRT